MSGLTLGAPLGCGADVLMPRIAVIGTLATRPCVWSTTLGAMPLRLVMLVLPLASTISLLNAAIAIGTSCTLSLRRCAVTTMSPPWGEASAAAGKSPAGAASVVWDCAGLAGRAIAPAAATRHPVTHGRAPCRERVCQYA